MTDTAQSDNPFDQLNSDAPIGSAPKPQANPFDELNSDQPLPVAQKSSTFGAFARGAERGAIPALGSLPAIGAGAELGAAAGAMTGPLAPVAAPVGGLLGGIAGGFLGAAAIEKAQNWALSKLPDSWKEKLGLDDRQEQLDQGEHPVASFLGGIAPYALTMRPGSVPTAALPENATALQRILAHPATKRLFGGAAMGGMELGQEATSDHGIDWRKAAVATGFGLVFNKPTRLGEAIIESGAAPGRAVAAPLRAAAASIWGDRLPEQFRPTIAQAADAKVMGPGVTEQVFQGAHDQDPAAATTAQAAARAEMEAVPPEPDIHATARRMHPELFAHYDDLLERQKALRGWIADAGEDGAPVAGEHLAATDAELSTVAPEVAAAYRRAAEATGSPVVTPPERFPSMAAMLAARGEGAPAEAAASEGAPPAEGLPPVPAKALAQQREDIAADATRQYLAAGEPLERAQLLGHLTAERYVQVAQRFENKIGSAEEIYRREGPQIRGVKPSAAPTGSETPPAAPTGTLAPIDASHDVVSGANSSKNPEGPVYVDKRIPEFSPTLKDGEGNPANLWNLLRLHEQTEADEMAKGASYERAHKIATAAERELATRTGIDFGAYTKEIDGYLAHIEKEKAENPPTDTHVDPEEAIGHHRSENKPEEEPAAAPVEVKARKRGGPAAQPPETWSLLQFLAARGGIRSDDPLASDLRQSFGGKNPFIPGFGSLIRDPKAISTAARKGGTKAPQFLDAAREAAVEAGYLEDTGEVTGGTSQSSVNDLLDAADREARGQRVYRRGHEPEQAIDRGEEDHRRRQFLDDLDETAKAGGGGSLTDKERDRALEMYEHEGLHDHDEILERIALENDDDAIDTGDTQGAEPEAIPGWDDVDTGGAPEAGGVLPAVSGSEGAAERATARNGGEGDREQNAQTFWQRFLDDRKERKASLRVAKGFNDHRTKSGAAPLRGQASQEWTPGNIVDVGFVKNLLIAKREPDGSFTLLAKPDAEGISQAYSSEQHGGLQRGEKVNFLETLKPLTDQAEQSVDEYFQRRQPRDLITEREGEGQTSLPGTDRISQAEQVQRKANQPLKPSVAQKPMDEGLFGDQKNQGELFQNAQGKVRLSEGRRPLITLFETRDASTAIHELGHVWLEETMRHAEHEAAPEQLKADSKTILDWLGVENSDAIKTRHHEKFARGFEQYLREGVAPSPQLASVFSRFRDWMLNVYQSIKGLGPEITPQIRDVFDRMLALEPQRTVIAPERMRPPTLADIHEEDAKSTEPAEAEPVADRIVAEASRFGHDLPPGIQDEHATQAEQLAAQATEAGTAADAGPEAGPGHGGPGPLDADRGEPGPVAPGGAGGAQSQPELRGGGEPVSEGGGAPNGTERPGSAGTPDAALGDQPLAPRPATIFGPADSPFVDKAGNIRRDVLNAPDDVWAAIKASAAANQDFIGDRRGVMTDGQLLDLAADIGMEGAEKIVAKWVRGQALNAEQVTSVANLVKAQGKEVARLAMLDKTQQTPESTLQYATETARLDMILKTFAGATAEAGRTLHAFRTMKRDLAEIDQILRDATGKTLFQTRQEAALTASLDTPQKVAKFRQDAQKRGFGKMVLEYWINGLISGPATHATYMIGNEILALQKAGPETAAAALLGSIRRAMGREGSTVRMGEVAEQLKAHVGSVPAALHAALEAFRTGVTTALPGERDTNLLPFQPGSELAEPATLNEAAKFSDAMQSVYGILRGAKDGFIAGGTLARASGAEPPAFGLSYSHLGAIPDIQIKGMNLLPLGTATRLPSRMVAAVHSFYRAMNYSMEKASDSYRTAANEGLTGTAFDARVGDLRQNPSPEAMERYAHTSNELTLMGQGGEFTKALSKLTNTPIFGLPIFKFIDPFVHISSNIIQQAIIERTPVGILSPEIRADIMGRNGTVAQDTAMARMLVGTAYAVAIGGLAAEGYVSGSGPSDPRQAAVWRLAGNQAHSVRIGDMWYDVHRLGPMGMLMGIAADLYDVAHVAESGDMLTAASHLQHAITQNVLDESFMRGPSDLIKAIDDPGRYGEAYVRNFLSSFTPYSVGVAQIARASDPYSRQARSVMDAIKAKIPGLSEQLMPRRDIWGEPMPNRDALLAPGVTAIYETRMSRDPVNLALLELGVSPGQLTRKIRNVDLTDQQYDDFQRIAGRMTKMRLDAIVRSPDFRTWPAHIRHDVISEVITQSREAARGVMMMKVPQIVKDATTAKLKKINGVTP